METIVNKNTLISKYLCQDGKAKLFNDFMLLGQTRVIDTNIHNSILYSVATYPEDWIGNKYLYDGENWSLNPDWIEPITNEIEIHPDRESMSVTMRQARLALHERGLLTSIQTAIDSLEEPIKSTVQIEWEYSSEIKRTHEWVISLCTGLGLSDDEIDELFIAAAQL